MEPIQDIKTLAWWSVKVVKKILWIYMLEEIFFFHFPFILRNTKFTQFLSKPSYLPPTTKIILGIKAHTADECLYKY